MKNKTLSVPDIKDIIIQQVVNFDNSCVEDIVVKFPEEFGIKPISFTEVGLINACPDLHVFNLTENYPKVGIEFFGKLEVVVNEDTKES